jgi:hypothetical protein
MKFRHLLTLLTSEIGVYECPVPNKLFQKNKCNGNRRHWYRFRRRVGDALPLATVLGIDKSNQASQIDAATITNTGLVLPVRFAISRARSVNHFAVVLARDTGTHIVFGARLYPN